MSKKNLPKLPKRMKVLGVIYDVIGIPDFEATGSLGTSCLDSKKIFLDTTGDPWGVFLHEIVHTLCSALGIEQKEEDEENEQLVREIEQVVRAFVVDNPDLIKSMVVALTGKAVVEFLE